MIRLIFSQTVPKQPISLLKNFFLHFVSSLFNNLKKNNSENVSTNLKNTILKMYPPKSTILNVRIDRS